MSLPDGGSMMPLELSNLGPTDDNATEVEHRSKPPEHQTSAAVVSNDTISLHNGVQHPREKSNADPISVEQPNNNNDPLPLEQLPQEEGKGSHGIGIFTDEITQLAITEVAAPDGSNSRLSNIDACSGFVQGELDNIERLSPRVEGEVLNLIRDKMLFLWGASIANTRN
ncbi:hypothetical protein ACLX1H_003316 [Fusarium chlamydosporum]